MQDTTGTAAHTGIITVDHIHITWQPLGFFVTDGETLTGPYFTEYAAQQARDARQTAYGREATR
jgi:hypothetical protein